MTFNTLLFMLGITEQYSIDVFRMMLALWSVAVGYLLYKRAKRVMSLHHAKVDIAVPQSDGTSLTPATYNTNQA